MSHADVAQCWRSSPSFRGFGFNPRCREWARNKHILVPKDIERHWQQNISIYLSVIRIMQTVVEGFRWYFVNEVVLIEKPCQFITSYWIWIRNSWCHKLFFKFSALSEIIFFVVLTTFWWWSGMDVSAAMAEVTECCLASYLVISIWCLNSEHRVRETVGFFYSDRSWQIIEDWITKVSRYSHYYCSRISFGIWCFIICRFNKDLQIYIVNYTYIYNKQEYIWMHHPKLT